MELINQNVVPKELIMKTIIQKKNSSDKNFLLKHGYRKKFDGKNWRLAYPYCVR